MLPSEGENEQQKLATRFETLLQNELKSYVVCSNLLCNSLGRCRD